ncbi:type VI secretion system baseplate subunit TssF [Aggregatibacter actinomycetemcomitans]|uniref:type VI secretion system baseplate subunit TssF n=1 Tax=Aggregatibacter actinomycetemcomitans TaxID=714 RepID=UPI00197C3A9F|nr:type VI secretion system baseplate subunit TssF [Aggregatibacter actinomycetemcomitans]MBN6078178.1 type VI secretion system baseplate subunit TssF [Aggregatibacter actinomycetemcomitans]
MSVLEKYFRNELEYLRELGEQLAVEKPHLANFLSEKSSDPDVERLLEGFAFLTGNLRAKIEDEFPEFTHSMINMLWPNYLRPTPSMTIVEFSPDEKVGQMQDRVEKGTYLLSKPISTTYIDQDNSVIDDGAVRCTFQTCRDVWLNPFSIQDITTTNNDEKAVVEIHFSSESELSFDTLDLNKLRFYLGSDEYSNQQLYLWLSYYLQSAKLIVNGITYPVPGISFTPVGFKREDAILPYPKHTNAGYRVLQEYFCFPESFLFFDVSGFEPLSPETKSKNFTLQLSFSLPLPVDVNVRLSTLRLHCVPAINLFKHDSENIRLDGTKTEYIVKGSHQHPDWYEIFSVDKVSSFVHKDDMTLSKKNNSGERIYEPFESFRHQVEYMKGRTALYYRLRTKEALFHSGFDHFLSFVRGDELQVLSSNECVAIDLTCTNRNLPTQLKIGDICMSTEQHPSSTRFRNITRPSLPLHPTLDGTLAWKLISNSSLNYLSLLDIEPLKEILKTYDLPAWHSRRNARISQKKLDAIQSIETIPIDRLFKGVSVRGLQSTLYIQQSGFISEGDMFLFGSVLSQFFTLYASVNSFHKLKIINTDNQEVYEWPIQMGQHVLM